MTALPEAKLAREAEICYAVIACVTDYDSWWEPGKPVDVATDHQDIEAIISRYRSISSSWQSRKYRNTPNLAVVLHALDGAIVTAAEKIPAATKKKLGFLINKYIK